MVLFPILGALALAISTLFEKIILRKRKIDIKLFTSATFLAVVIVLFPFIYFFWNISSEAFTFTNILILGIVIIFSIIANFLIFYSMRWEKVSNLEPARLLEPLFVIILSLFFSFWFSESLFDGNKKVIIPALIASIALIISHINKNHLSFNKYFIASIFGSLFFGLELVLSRFILDYYSPLSFYFVRAFIVLVILVLFFKPNFCKLNKKTDFSILLIAIFWVIYRIIVYYGYLQIGIVFTTLLIMLSPIFIYFFAFIYLKEKPTWKNIISAIIIVVCVLYASLV